MFGDLFHNLINQVLDTMSKPKLLTKLKTNEDAFYKMDRGL